MQLHNPGGASIDLASPGAIGGTTPAAGTFTGLTVAQGTLPDPATGLNLTATWNDAADTFRGVDITITDTNSASGSTPLRIRGGAAGTTTLLEVSKAGNLKVGNVVNSDTYLDLKVSGANKFGLGSSTNVCYQPLRMNAFYLEFAEQTAPSAPSTNQVRIYAEDNGSGKTRIMALFATGAAQQIAIEP